MMYHKDIPKLIPLFFKSFKIMNRIVLNRKNDITFGGYIQFVDRDMGTV